MPYPVELLTQNAPPQQAQDGVQRSQLQERVHLLGLTLDNQPPLEDQLFQERLQRERLTHELEQYRQQNQVLTVQYTEKQREIEQLQAYRAQDAQLHQADRQQIEALDQQVSALRSQAQSLDQQVRATSQQMQVLQAQIDQLLRQNNEQQRQIIQLLQHPREESLWVAIRWVFDHTLRGPLSLLDPSLYKY